MFGCGERREREVDYSARALERVVGDFRLLDTFRKVHPGDAGYTWPCFSLSAHGRAKWGSGFWRLNTLLLEADAFKAAFTSFYRSSVRTLRSMYGSVVEWWERPSAVLQNSGVGVCDAAERIGQGVAKWTADLSYLHGCFNRGEHVDWALYEGVKERGAVGGEGRRPWPSRPG
ncbi:hypothetical protein AAFF_G00088880 [Aldrovandia affinis]|uniref:Uncharacterized protein n=1 Tax=Aldrovandia affinis TaxID=143900 RepID=A0AAD7R1K7_9TELE|nr:hypothetical protein AAFF_G00088880 [Aldrovandia affinis]